jgi:hypothetical protein
MFGSDQRIVYLFSFVTSSGAAVYPTLMQAPGATARPG